MSAIARRIPSEESALARLEAACARAEHCSYELREKLRRWGVDRDASERIMASLIKHKFVDDARFARSYVNDKVKFARWGRRKVAMGLAAKRISRDIAAEALDSVDTQLYEENLRHLLLLKAPTLPADADCHSYDGRTRLFRFAVSRGYDVDLAGRLIRELFS